MTDKLSGDLIASAHRWYVACGLEPDENGEYRKKRNDVPQPVPPKPKGKSK